MEPEVCILDIGGDIIHDQQGATETEVNVFNQQNNTHLLSAPPLPVV